MPSFEITEVIQHGSSAMTHLETQDICCAALELSKSTWILAFSAPSDGNAVVHKIKSGDTNHLIHVLTGSKEKAEDSSGPYSSTSSPVSAS